MTSANNADGKRHDFIEGHGGLCRRCGCGPDWKTHTEQKDDLREPTLTDLLVIIRRETRPIEGHDDPGAINDCWMEVFDRLALIDTYRAERDKRLKDWLMKKAVNSTGNYQAAIRDVLAELSQSQSQGEAT